MVEASNLVHQDNPLIAMIGLKMREKRGNIKLYSYFTRRWALTLENATVDFQKQSRKWLDEQWWFQNNQITAI